MPHLCIVWVSMLLSNLLVEHVFLKWISVRNRIASLFVLCAAPFSMWNHIYHELHFSDIEVCQIYFRRNMFFFRGLLPICCFHFHGSSFPLEFFSLFLPASLASCTQLYGAVLQILVLPGRAQELCGKWEYTDLLMLGTHFTSWDYSLPRY